MKADETEIIDSCESQLVVITICGEDFILFFKEKQCFTRADCMAVLSETNPIKQSAELYRRLVTKENGYPVLIEALHKTRQNGVLELLRKHEKAQVVDRTETTSRHGILEERRPAPTALVLPVEISNDNEIQMDSGSDSQHGANL